MASTYTAAKAGSGVQPRASLGYNVEVFEYSVATVADGDVINLCKLPKGATIVNFAINTDKAVAGTGGTIKVGYNDGTTNDDDALVTSTVATGAIAPTFGVAAAGFKAVTAAAATVFATLGSSGTPGSAVKVKGMIGYLMGE